MGHGHLAEAARVAVEQCMERVEGVRAGREEQHSHCLAVFGISLADSALELQRCRRDESTTFIMRSYTEGCASV